MLTMIRLSHWSQQVASEFLVLDPQNEAVASYRQQGPEVLALAESIHIANDTELEIATEHVKATSAACKGIETLFKPAKQALTQAKKQVDNLEKSLRQGFEKADEILRAKITAYHVARQRAAEEERKRLEAEETKRREDEQVAAAARMENLANATGDQHFRSIAERTLDMPIQKPTVTVQTSTPKGITFREETDVRVDDLKKLVHAVDDGGVDLQAVKADEKWLRKQAEARGNAVADGDELFPGVAVVKTPDVTVRTR